MKTGKSELLLAAEELLRVVKDLQAHQKRRARELEEGLNLLIQEMQEGNRFIQELVKNIQEDTQKQRDALKRYYQESSEYLR